MELHMRKNRSYISCVEKTKFYVEHQHYIIWQDISNSKL
jgi:hypothetical protein